MPTYSGGLGVLAGDTLRAAADLGVPMVGVTLLHRKGYFHQRLDAERLADRRARRLGGRGLPARRCRSGRRVTIEGRTVALRGWKYAVPGSEAATGAGLPPRYRPAGERRVGSRPDGLTSTAATSTTGSARRSILGIGGVRMLRALGYDRDRAVPHERGPRGLLTPGAPGRAGARRRAGRRSPATTSRPCGSGASSRRTRRSRRGTTSSRSTW